MDLDDWRNANLVELLTEPHGRTDRDWAAELVVRALQTRGSCRYRNGSLRLGRADTSLALASVRAAVAALTAGERPLLLRVLLLMPWELVRRSTGLPLEASEVLAAAGEVAGTDECLSAAAAVIEQGTKAVSSYPLEGLLPEACRTGEGLVFSLDAASARRLGVRPGQFEVDRLQAAARGYRSRGWESNLRNLVVWWLGRTAAKDAAKALRQVFRSLPATPTSDRDHAVLLGLVDWTAERPDHALAGAVLEKAPAVSVGRIRKTATRLASALRRRDLLATLAEHDPDRSVRKRARELLEQLDAEHTDGARGAQGDLFG